MSLGSTDSASFSWPPGLFGNWLHPRSRRGGEEVTGGCRKEVPRACAMVHKRIVETRDEPRFPRAAAARVGHYPPLRNISLTTSLASSGRCGSPPDPN